MAEIFLARAPSEDGLEQDVVIKRIHPRWAEHPDVLSLFRDEARLGSNLDHRNIVRVLDYGRAGDTAYLVLEYVDGRNLADLMETLYERGEYVDTAIVVYAFTEVARALEHLHTRCDPSGEPLGIVHRDLNPSNILLSYDGEVKLTDFGVAAGLHRQLRTEHGILRGTFPYMSPEQSACRPVDHRSDLFSFGTCLYEVLTGRHPFVADSDYETLRRIQEDDPPPPSALRASLDPRLDGIVVRCLKKAAEERYADAGALRRDLLDWLEEAGETSPKDRLVHRLEAVFPPTEPRGERVEPVEIAIDEARGKPPPLLSLSRLDRRSSLQRDPSPTGLTRSRTPGLLEFQAPVREPLSFPGGLPDEVPTLRAAAPEPPRVQSTGVEPAPSRPASSPPGGFDAGSGLAWVDTQPPTRRPPPYVPPEPAESELPSAHRIRRIEPAATTARRPPPARSTQTMERILDTEEAGSSVPVLPRVPLHRPSVLPYALAGAVLVAGIVLLLASA